MKFKGPLTGKVRTRHVGWAYHRRWPEPPRRIGVALLRWALVVIVVAGGGQVMRVVNDLLTVAVLHAEQPNLWLLVEGHPCWVCCARCVLNDSNYRRFISQYPEFHCYLPDELKYGNFGVHETMVCTACAAEVRSHPEWTT